MFARKLVFLAVLAAAVFALSVQIASSESASAGTNADPPRLGGEIVISALPNAQYAPAAAYNSRHNEYLVVWHNTSAGSAREVWASRVSPQGFVLDSFRVGTLLSFNDHSLPAVAYDPVRDRYLVVWIYDFYGNGSDWDVYGRFIPWNGPDPSLTEFAINQWSSDQWDPQLVYAVFQDEFMVTWTNIQTSAPAYISGLRIAADGSGFPAGPFTVASHLTQVRVNHQLAYNNSRNQVLVTYDNGTDIFGALLNGDGTLARSEFAIAGWPDVETYPAVASCPGWDQFLVLWHSLTTNGDYDIFARYLAGDGSAGAVLTVHNWIIDEQHAAVECSASGQRYLVAWEQQNANLNTGIWGRTIDTGAVMDTAFEIAAAGPNADRSRPAVSAGSPSSLIVWQHERQGTSYLDIHGRLHWSQAVFLPLILRP